MCDLIDTSCNCPPLTNAVKSDLFVKRRLATFSEIIRGSTIIHNDGHFLNIGFIQFFGKIPIIDKKTSERGGVPTGNERN